jgi:predicted nucleotidyltransferase
MSIAASLFSPAQSKLFAWLFNDANRTYHLGELARLTGLGSASLQREIKRLFDAGLLVDERVGNLRLIRANVLSPIYTELSGIVDKTLGVPIRLRSALQALELEIICAVLYGSVAKKTDRADSDIDLMIISDTLNFASAMQALSDCEQALQRQITPTIFTSEAFLKRLKEPDSFVNRVLAQPHQLLLGEVPKR